MEFIFRGFLCKAPVLRCVDEKNEYLKNLKKAKNRCHDNELRVFEGIRDLNP
jgi:hypothetical protein